MPPLNLEPPLLKVIPAPRNVAPGTGQLRVEPGASVEYPEAGLAPIVNRFRQDVARRTGLRLEGVQTARSAATGVVPSIRIELGGGTDLDALPASIGISPLGEITQNEGYSLTIGADRIVVHGIEAVGEPVLLLALADPALAKWWIVRAADEKCLVVDIEPLPDDKDVTKVGKNVYETQEQAEADLKRLCKETNAPPRDPATDK